MVENVDQTLVLIKSQIKAHEKLRRFRDLLDDKLLIGGVNYDVEKAIKYLECFIEMRTIKHSDFTRTHRPSSCALAFEGCRILKNKDPLGRPVVLLQCSTWNPELTPGDAIIAVGLFVFDEAIRTIFSNNNEYVCIVDCDSFTLKHAMQMTPRRIILGINMTMKSIPTRPKAIHIINEGMLTRNVFRGIKPLFPKKIRERLQLHSNGLDSLHEYIPANILPVGSLGGELEVDEAYDHSLTIRIKRNEEFYQKFSELVSAEPSA